MLCVVRLVIVVMTCVCFNRYILELFVLLSYFLHFFYFYLLLFFISRAQALAFGTSHKMLSPFICIMFPHLENEQISQ